MKNIILLLLFFIAFGVHGQSYYVAIIKGNVYYEGKLLKKRDKITQKGTLKFSSKDDYIKVSGPGGLRTFHPKQLPNDKHEFLLALKDEMFGKVEIYAVSGANQVFHLVDCNLYFCFDYHHQVFQNRQALHVRSKEREDAQSFGLLHITDSSFYYTPIELQDSSLILKSAYFDNSPSEDTIQQSYIMLIRDSLRWQQLLSRNNLDSIHQQIDYYSIHAASPPPSYDIDSLGNLHETLPLLPVAQKLDFLNKCSFYTPFEFNGQSYTLYDNTPRKTPHYWWQKTQSIGIVHESTDGLYFKPLTIIDSSLVLKQQDFTLKHSNKQILRSAIVLVHDSIAWNKKIQQAQTIADLATYIDAYVFKNANLLDVQNTLYNTSPFSGEVVEILGGNTRLINQESFESDILFHKNASKAYYLNEFLEHFNYQEYIQETYGRIYQLKSKISPLFW